MKFGDFFLRYEKKKKTKANSQKRKGAERCRGGGCRSDVKGVGKKEAFKKSADLK